MRIRPKLTLTLLALTLAPLATIGMVTDIRAKSSLRDSLGATHERMAAAAIDKVDRALYTVEERVRLWVGLEVMQEVLTGDLDGRISSFLFTVGKDSSEFATLEAFDTRGEIVASSQPDYVGLVLDDDSALRAALRGDSVVGDVSWDGIREAWLVPMCAPIRAGYEENEQGEVIGALCARWSVRELVGMVEHSPGVDPSEGAQTLIVRSDGAVLPPGSEATGPFSGNLVERGFRAVGLAQRGGTGFMVEELPGRAYLVGYSHSRGYRRFPGLGWSALVIQDLDRAGEPIRDLELVIVGTGAVATLVVVGLALGISHRLASPMVRMSEVARRVAEGDFDGRVSYRSSDEIGTLATVFNRMIGDLQRRGEERRVAEERVRASLAEKEVLLKEIHHRVKNNLQVIISLLSLQSEHLDDPRILDMFRESESRIRSMALIHEMLYRSENLSRIDVSDYLERLTGDLVNVYAPVSTGVALELECEGVALGMDTAILLGLLVNELVSNALKHAFPEAGPGVISIGLSEPTVGRFRLVVSDDGVGLPAEVDLSAETLGLSLVRILARQLEAEVAVRREGGTRFEIDFHDVTGEEGDAEAGGDGPVGRVQKA